MATEKYEGVAHEFFGMAAVVKDAADAQKTASWLSTRGRPLHGQLDRVPHHRGPRTGVALVEGALAAFECRTRATHRDGDHEIVVGDVLFVDRPDRAGAALVRHRSTYGSVG